MHAWGGEVKLNLKPYGPCMLVTKTMLTLNKAYTADIHINSIRWYTKAIFKCLVKEAMHILCVHCTQDACMQENVLKLGQLNACDLFCSHAYTVICNKWVQIQADEYEILTGENCTKEYKNDMTVGFFCRGDKIRVCGLCVQRLYNC